jgi:hypothetical protein
MSNIGDPIRFVKGKYKGKTGWCNKDKESTRERLYVIVDLGDGVIRRTFVKKTSAKPAVQPNPASYSEAVLQECPDVEEKLDKLCLELALASKRKRKHNKVLSK